MTKLPRIVETAPGVFAGRNINALLLPQDIAVLLSVSGDIFGGPYASIFRQRIDQLNGFSNTVNAFNYQPRFTPGSFNRPFVRNNFLIEYGVGNNSIWANRISQFATDPNPTAGTGGTNGLCLWINGMPSRTIYLIRESQPVPVYFHFPLQSTIGGVIPVPTNLQNAAIYFSTDCVGGGPQNSINGSSAGGSVLGTPPPLLQGTSLTFPGNTTYIIPTNNMPDQFYIQTTAFPFGGAKVVLVGRSQ
jgi:hypothetical protein